MIQVIFKLVSKESKSLKLADIFIGFTDDTIASLTLKVCQEYEFDDLTEADEYAAIEVSTAITEKIKLHSLIW